MLSTEMDDKIRQHLLKYVDPYLIVVFGSAINGQFREESDIDLAFLSDRTISGYDLYMVAQSLAGKLGREIDLVDLKKASTVFKAKILGQGKIIYSLSEEKLADFRIRTFKEYSLLNEERAEIMQNVLARGRVYGRFTSAFAMG